MRIISSHQCDGGDPDRRDQNTRPVHDTQSLGEEGVSPDRREHSEHRGKDGCDCDAVSGAERKEHISERFPTPASTTYLIEDRVSSGAPRPRAAV